jgi:hypothetical protein
LIVSKIPIFWKVLLIYIYDVYISIANTYIFHPFNITLYLYLDGEKEVTFTIDEDKNYFTANKCQYRNGSLKLATIYNLKLWVFTAKEFQDA